MVDGKITEVINSYEIYLIEKKKVSEATLSAYMTDIKRFNKFIDEVYKINSLADVSSSILMSYLLKLKQDGRASSSIARSISVIRNFLLYCYHENIIDENLSEVKLEMPKEKKKLPETLTVEEINILLSQPEDTVLGYRDKAMLETLYTSGLKVNEMINLKIDDLDLKLKLIRFTSKSGTRHIPLGSMALVAIEDYLTFSRDRLLKEGVQYLFLSYNGDKISRQGFWKLVKKYAKLAGINKNITISTFRHSFASHMIQNGIHKEVLKETLGNVNVASVQKYLDLNRKRKL